MRYFLILFSTLLMLGQAHAQIAAAAEDSTTAQTASTTPAVLAPELSYQSVFGDYQRYREQTVTPWPTNNNEVHRIGGWRAYSKEAHKHD